MILVGVLRKKIKMKDKTTQIWEEQDDHPLISYRFFIQIGTSWPDQ